MSIPASENRLEVAVNGGSIAAGAREQCASTAPVVRWVALLALLGGCATAPPNTLPKYEPPSTKAPAAVIEVGNHGHAWSVDGAQPPAFSKKLRLAPGEHQVGISCKSSEVVGLAAFPGGPQMADIPMWNTKPAFQSVLVTGTFEQGKTYYMRCVAVNGQPRVWLTDAPAGDDLPRGFTSICTRECPQ